MKTVLVIAFKFNDIIYSLNTNEYKLSDKSYLVILYNNIDPNFFPYTDCFDKVYNIKYKKKRLFTTLVQIFYSINLKIDYIITSNPILIITQYIIRQVKAKKVIMIEDGLMNYLHHNPSESKIKKILQLLFGIKEKQIYNSIQCSYLLDPNKAIFFYGKKIKLDFKEFNKTDTISHLNFMQNKSFFVGQNLYHLGYMTKSEYKSLVEKTMKGYNIDFYIPHPHGDKDENLDVSIFDISKEQTTLEICSIFYNFSIFSISSSVLFSTKNINPNIKCYIVENIYTDISPILLENCNGIAKIKD
ncbi:MAG: hypothetical protein E6767_00035 [Dysgonomonas sp.]|nr:hypothetical protein [Dysgonomonas sp.]